MVLFIVLYKAALTFESVDKSVKCDYSNESYIKDITRRREDMKFIFE